MSDTEEEGSTAEDRYQVDLLVRESANRRPKGAPEAWLVKLWDEIQAGFVRKTMLLLIVCCWAGTLNAQGITNGAAPKMIWNTPPMLGMWSPDSERVDDALQIVASADWPASADTVLAELRDCTGLRGAVDGWTLRTVASAFFNLRVRETNHGGPWHNVTFTGFTFPSVKRIYVVQRELHVRRLLKHEILHAMLAAHGFNPSHGTSVADEMFARCLPDEE